MSAKAKRGLKRCVKQDVANDMSELFSFAEYMHDNCMFMVEVD